MILLLVSEIPETLSSQALRSLSEGERARATSLQHLEDRKRFVAGRHLLQTAITELTGTEKNYTIEQKENGKPYLVNAPSCLDFSLSHSGRAIAVVVSSNGRVGLDIECITAIDPSTIESALTARELETLTSLPAEERAAACFRLWCEKEALAKLSGAESLQGGLGSAMPARGEPGRNEIRSWTLDLGPEKYQLCLAYEGTLSADLHPRRVSL